MTKTAYHNDVAVRTLHIERLCAHVAAGRLVSGPLEWTGEQGSLAGCLTESADIAEWEKQLGLPQWLAVVLDALAGNLHEPADVLEFGITALEAIHPGASLSTTGSRLVLRLLEAAEQDSDAVLPAVAASLRAVGALHRRAVAGEPVAPAEWRAARKAATAVTDTLEEETPAHELASCAESAAWDPQRSNSTVNDVIRLWQNSSRAKATQEAGWTKEVDTRIRARLEEMFQVHMGGVQGPTITVFDMLAKYHPEDHDLVLGRNKIDSDVSERLNARAAALLLETLRAA